MAEHEQPQGLDSGMLTSMGAYGGSAGSFGPTTSMFGGNILGEGIELHTPGGVDKKSIDLGLGGSIDNELFSSINQNAAFKRNPVLDVGDGTTLSPAKINAFQGMGMLGSELQNMKMENVTPGPQFNAKAPGFPGVGNSGQGQGH